MPFPNLRADSMYINPGNCTNIRWDIDGIQAIFFVEDGNESGTTGHDSRGVLFACALPRRQQRYA